MISAGDFRNGVTFEMDGNVYQIIEFQHVKPAREPAFVQASRSAMSAGTVWSALQPNDKYPHGFR